MECILKKTSQFKSSYKLAKKRGLDISLLEELIDKLAANELIAIFSKSKTFYQNLTSV